MATNFRREIGRNRRHAFLLGTRIPQRMAVWKRRWRHFGDFLRAVFSASRAQHVSDLHSKFTLRPHHVWTVEVL